MKPALGYQWLAPPKHWRSLPNGYALQAAESEKVDSHLQNCFGFHMLQLGCLTSQLQFSRCTIGHQVKVTPERDSEHITVSSELDELPFANSSVDLVVMNHVLEFSVDPHQVLREVHRALVANGHIVITLFNPWSTLLLHKVWPISRHSALANARLFSASRIKDWLNLLGFEVTETEYFAHHALLTQAMPLDDNRWSRLWRRVLPRTGSVCLIKAKKREWPLTPIRPRYKYRPKLTPAITRASANKTL